MPDPVQQIVDQVRRVAEAASRIGSGVTTGTVLSRNSDGSVNVDDGSGGCARVASIQGQSTACGATVILGVEPAIGNQSSVCPVSITISSSTKPCLTDTRSETEPEALVAGFLDNQGRTYDFVTGAAIAIGGDTADVDAAFGYSVAGDDCFTGASPGYADLNIGNVVANTGYQGESYYANNTVLCLGVGVSSGLLCGAELPNAGGYAGNERWQIVIRDAVTFAVIARNTDDYIYNWMIAHPADFPLFGGDQGASYDVNFSADPEDGTFWVLIGGNAGPGTEYVAPIFNVSPADGSLIHTVGLQVPDGNDFRRARRYVTP